MVTNSGFKVTPRFTVTDSIASTTRKLITVLEGKHKGILSLNQIKLASHVDDLKIILILQNEILLLMLLCERVLKQSEDIPRYVNTINNSFFGTLCSNIFCENCLFKNIFMHLSTKLVGKNFFFNTSFR